MSYYATNAVYRRLEAAPDPRLVWVSGSAWILIYADANASARTIVFVEGASMGRAAQADIERAEQASGVARQLAARAEVPFAMIQFDDLSREIDTVVLDGQRISLPDLKAWFASAGLPVNEGAAQKAINSQQSSAYHDWQRGNLGAITVSDVDLIRLAGDAQTPAEIIELKRSFYELGRWSPYRQDYPNFNVISEVTDRVGARFTIAYNRRITSPAFVDDASRLSLFSYSRSHGARALGEFSFEQFANGAY